MDTPTDAFPWPALHGQDALDWLEAKHGAEALKLYREALARHLPGADLSYEVTAPCAYEDEDESARQFVIHVAVPLDDEHWDRLIAMQQEVLDTCDAPGVHIDPRLVSVVRTQ